MKFLNSQIRLLPAVMLTSVLAIGCSDRGFKLAENNEVIGKVLAAVEAGETAVDETEKSEVAAGENEGAQLGFTLEEIQQTVEHLIREDQERRDQIRENGSALEGDEVYDAAQEVLVEKIVQSTGQFIKGVRIVEASPLKANSDYSVLERNLIVHMLMNTGNGQRAVAVGGLKLQVNVGSRQSGVARVETVKWDQNQVFGGEKVVLSAWCMDGACSLVKLIVEDRFTNESLVAEFKDNGAGGLELVNSQFAVETEFSLLEAEEVEEAGEAVDLSEIEINEEALF